jgi:hypothetical protein
MIELQERPPARAETGLTDTQRADIQGLLKPGYRAPLVESYADNASNDTPTRHFEPAATWVPASSQRIRTAEGVMALAVMAYFATGLLKTLGLF